MPAHRSLHALRLLALAWVFLAPAPLPAATTDVALEATLNPQVITLGSAANLELRFVNCVPSKLPNITPVDGLSIRYISQGRQTSVINTEVQRSFVLNYQVRPSRAGQFTIPTIRSLVDRRTLASQPLSLRVVKPATNAVQSVWLSLAFPKNDFFVGEATAVDVHLYSQHRILDGRAPGLSASGAIVGTNVPIGQPIQIATNNVIYSRIAWKVPVTFAKAGLLRFSAENCQLQLELPRPRNRDPFMFRSLFDFPGRTNITLGSPAVAVNVHPLPTNNVPPDFSGAVGQFSMEAAVTTTNLAAGDPVTLTLRLSGQGNLDALKWSAPDDWPGLRNYPPSSRLDVADPLGLTGTRTVEQVLIPESTAVSSIPKLAFSYFDPVNQAYRTITHPGFELRVQPANTATAQPLIARQMNSDEDAPAADIVHIKSRPGSLAILAPPPTARTWFWIAATLPGLLWLIAIIQRKRLDKLAANPREIRRRRVARRVREGLGTLKQHAQADAAADFHHELFRLLQEQLGERLDLPASSITGDVVGERLPISGADPDLIRRVEDLFGRCDQARYAPEALAGELMSLLSAAESVLRELQTLDPAASQANSTPGSAPPLALFLLASLCLLSDAGLAATPRELFFEGNRAYEQGRYGEAAQAYQALIDQGRSSAPVHFNLGNTFFRSGQLGKAIAEYRIAESLAPRDPDIGANLRFARQQVPGTASVTPPTWIRPLRQLRLFEWTLLVLATMWVLFALLIVGQWQPHLRSRLRRWAFLNSFALLVFAGATLLVWNHEQANPLAVVTDSEVALRYGPLEESSTHFKVREGTELAVEDVQGDWVKLRDAADRAGWTQRSTLWVPDMGQLF